MKKPILTALLGLIICACGSSGDAKEADLASESGASEPQASTSGAAGTDEDKSEFYVRQNAAMMGELATAAEKHKADCDQMAGALGRLVETNKPKRLAARRFAANNSDSRTAEQLMIRTHTAVAELSAASEKLAVLMVQCAENPKMKALFPVMQHR